KSAQIRFARRCCTLAGRVCVGQTSIYELLKFVPLHAENAAFGAVINPHALPVRAFESKTTDWAIHFHASFFSKGAAFVTTCERVEPEDDLLRELQPPTR